MFRLERDFFEREKEKEKQENSAILSGVFESAVSTNRICLSKNKILQFPLEYLYFCVNLLTIILKATLLLNYSLIFLTQFFVTCLDINMCWIIFLFVSLHFRYQNTND